MQLILISNRLRIAKSVVLSARQLTAGAVIGALFVLVAATALSYFALQRILGSHTATVQSLLVSSKAAPLPPPASTVSTTPATRNHAMMMASFQSTSLRQRVL